MVAPLGALQKQLLHVMTGMPTGTRLMLTVEDLVMAALREVLALLTMIVRVASALQAYVNPHPAEMER
jgi:hypothetical protein